jgi:hypothetical protein
VQSSDPVQFDLKFAATLGASIISTIILAAVAFAAFPIPTETPLLYVIIAAVTSGYALNDGINRGVTTYWQLMKETRLVWFHKRRCFHGNNWDGPWNSFCHLMEFCLEEN